MTQSATHAPHLPPATAAVLACQWEAVASKPGNVNRYADFSDLNLVDFLNSAAMIGQSISAASTEPKNLPSLGSLVLSMVQSTQQACHSNSNLGISLLFAPLTLACSHASTRLSKVELQQRTAEVLASTNSKDTQDIYHAIRLANPGGLGQVENKDVHHQQEIMQSDTPITVMKLAADRDSIAAEYANDFAITFSHTVPTIQSLRDADYPLHWTILGTFIQTLSKYPDSLIQRKLGQEFATEISRRAAEIEKLWPDPKQHPFSHFQQEHQEIVVERLADLDFYLRADGNQRNPGTTADLIAAGLFAALLTGVLSIDAQW